MNKVAWFKVDDNFYDHPKVDDLSLEAVGLWLLCGTYSARHLTDGFIPTRRAYRMGATEETVAELVDAELWEVVDGGYQYRNWAEYQPTKASVEEGRRKERERKRRYRRDKRGRYTGVPVEVPSGVQDGVPSGVPEVSQWDRQGDSLGVSREESHQPDPTRPVPLISSDSVVEKHTDSVESLFEDWYKDYPRKEGKGQARRAFKGALKKTDLATLKAGLQRYVKSVEGKDKQFIAMPATWLNGERWDDDYTPIREEFDPWKIKSPMT